ncbi:hypothetical protein [Paenibacillus sp. Soil766]|uniref:hypothetical protein n=1 Tax=Paenibacillus sp. Soil766 TaxID=1736404 RepID=UPI000AE6CA37|nr:hypothetical protein [Paenibacillus sp. Soil766]
MIDRFILYSKYLGGGFNFKVTTKAVDASGNAFVTVNDGYDTFVAKIGDAIGVVL